MLSAALIEKWINIRQRQVQYEWSINRKMDKYKTAAGSIRVEHMSGHRFNKSGAHVRAQVQ
jgi:hypothetical protein